MEPYRMSRPDYGKWLYDNGLYHECLGVLNEALEDSPEDTRVLEFMAMANMRLGNRDEAEKLFIRISRVEPSNPYADMGLQEIWLARSREEESGETEETEPIPTPRPMGVEVVSVVLGLVAVLQALAGFILLFGGGIFTAMGLLLILGGTAHWMIARGLWRFEDWARSSGMAVIALDIVVVVVLALRVSPLLAIFAVVLAPLLAYTATLGDLFKHYVPVSKTPRRQLRLPPF